MKICLICAEDLDENDEFIILHDDRCYVHKECSKQGYKVAVIEN